MFISLATDMVKICHFGEILEIFEGPLVFH